MWEWACVVYMEFMIICQVCWALEDPSGAHHTWLRQKPVSENLGTKPTNKRRPSLGMQLKNLAELANGQRMMVMTSAPRASETHLMGSVRRDEFLMPEDK